ncbi:MAG: GYD domain-containing protein, partial [Pseudolabrys sp.]
PSPYYYARRNNHKSQREVSMIRLVTRGRFTRDYAKGLIAAPEDREPVVRKLIEGAGGKLVNFYFTTGDADFLLITETNEAESAIAALLATAAAGTICDVTTSRAWTGAEFKAVADKASKVASLYSPPGKK